MVHHSREGVVISSSYRSPRKTQNGGEGRGERKDAGEETLDLINLHRLIQSDSLPPASPISCIFRHFAQEQQQQLRTTHSIHEPEEDLSPRAP